jgi:hypothetical protein
MATYGDYVNFRRKLKAEKGRGTAGDDARAFPDVGFKTLLAWDRRYRAEWGKAA